MNAHNNHIWLVLLELGSAVLLPVVSSAQPRVEVLANGQWAIGAGNLVAEGDIVYIAQPAVGLQILDFRNPQELVRLGGIEITNIGSGLAVAGSRVFVANWLTNYDSVLEVFDVSNPTNCVRLGGCDIAGFVEDVDVVGNYAYVSGWSVGLQIIDVSNPTNCVHMGRYTTGGRVWAAAVARDHAFLADMDLGLVAINVSCPTNCVRVGGYRTSGMPFDVVVAGNYAYVADYHQGLQVIDISDPTNCVRVGGFATAATAWHVAVRGNRAYLTTVMGPLVTGQGGPGVVVIDVTNPTNCVFLGQWNVAPVGRVAVAANRIYVSADPGLRVLTGIPSVQYTLRVTATPGIPFTLEMATNVVEPSPWSALLTTNVAVMPFDFVDFDVSSAKYPRKFYRVRQP